MAFAISVIWLLLNAFYMLFGVVGFIGGLCLLFTTVAYILINLAIQHPKKQIQALQVQDVEGSVELVNFASHTLISSHTKYPVGIFYVYLLLLISYLPLFIWFLASEVDGPSIILSI